MFKDYWIKVVTLSTLESFQVAVNFAATKFANVNAKNDEKIVESNEITGVF